MASSIDTLGSLVLHEQVKGQYGGMRPSYLGSAIAATVYAGIVYGLVDSWKLALWLAAVYVQAGGRALLRRAYLRHAPRPQDAARWGRYALAGSTASGVLWGCMGLFLMVPGRFDYQAYAVLFIVAIGANSVFASASYLPAFYGFFYPATVPIILRLMADGGSIQQILGWSSVMYLPPMTIFAHFINRTIRDSHRLRFENLGLIEELKRQKNAADQANIAKSRFLAAASHDLRQPLHAIELFVKALHQQALPEAATGLLLYLERSVSAMRGLFDALLDISRLDAGVVEPEIRETALAPLLERIAQDARAMAEGRPVSVTLVATQAWVHTDAVLLAVVLSNLVANAVRYTPQGRVVLGCRRHGGELAVEVWDTGLGIPANRLDDIFQEYVQLGNPERDRSKGLGLGLAIVKRLCSLLGHRVEVQSWPGRGSRFRVLMPLSARRGAPEPAPLRPQPNEDGGGRLVVVIDDEGDIRNAMAALLTGWGFRPVVAGSAADAMALLAAEPLVPALLVSDYRLAGDSNGIDAINELRLQYNQDLPGILITGDTDPVRIAQAQASGLPVLHKPVQTERLRQLMFELASAG
ncbi:MAG: hybrid sensor histidine kinase/response regulator [Burkholderiales bacterium]|nr:hybrid sensor histidine kinase/response regulator [Burkholderiales bacterium]